MGLTVPIQALSRLHASIEAELRAVFDDHLKKSAFIQGAPVKAFEEAFSRYTGLPHVLGVANGTDAIELVLEALGVGAGHSVIVPSMTFTATGEAPVRQGATPVFADVDPATWCLSVKTAEEALARAAQPVKALILVHLHGKLFDPQPLADWCAKKGIALIEDCAQAHGARLSVGGVARHAGSWGVASTFSFYPGKNLGALGDGGAVATASRDLAERIRLLRDHGRTEKYLHREVGRNSRLDALQAGFLKAKLSHLDQWNKGRRALAARYLELLPAVKGFTLAATPPGAEAHAYHQIVGLVDRGLSRDGVKAKLADRGIETGVHYPLGLHQQPAFEKWCRGLKLPVTEDLSGRQLSLPMDPLHGPEVAATVTAALTAVLREGA
jgi:dTDP-4-amino-4,6-dideoxygalactose transaminase